MMAIPETPPSAHKQAVHERQQVVQHHYIFLCSTGSIMVATDDRSCIRGWQGRAVLMSGLLLVCILIIIFSIVFIENDKLPLEEGFSTQSLASNDVCYRSTQLEYLTARDWWNNSDEIPEGLAPTRTKWFRDRRPFEPIVGDDTVIAGVLYTNDKTFRMSIFFPPMYPQENRRVEYSILGSESIAGVAGICEIQNQTWYCPVEIEALDKQQDYSFQINYQPEPVMLPRLVYTYSGSVPRQAIFPKIATLGGFGIDNTKNKDDLVKAVLETKPDLLVLQGDQTYLHHAIGYGFVELIYTLNRLTKDIPTLVQMDDHDYGEGNLWGAGSYASENSGKGFHLPPCILNALQSMAMSHMPTPATNKTLANGIDEYYNSYSYGAVNFAVLEARKFKSLNDTKGSLLGEDQEQWLKSWCSYNDTPAALKVILTQTSFSAISTNWSSPSGGITSAWFQKDTNAFPFEGRQRFMDIARGCTPLILAGDMHFAAAISYDDDHISEITSPAVINDICWRMNFNKLNGTYDDGYGNRYRLLRVWNPDELVWRGDARAIDTRNDTVARKALRGDGFLTIALNGETAICEAHGYRGAHTVVWSVEVPAAINAVVVE